MDVIENEGQPSEDNLIFPVLDQEEEELDYPVMRKFVGSTVSIGNFDPPRDVTMGPAGYAPAVQQRPFAQTGESSSYQNRFKRREPNEWFNLPQAQSESGAIFVVPLDLGMDPDVFSRWESITLNHVNQKT